MFSNLDRVVIYTGIALTVLMVAAMFALGIADQINADLGPFSTAGYTQDAGSPSWLFDPANTGSTGTNLTVDLATV